MKKFTSFNQIKSGQTDQQLICFPYFGAHPNVFSEFGNNITDAIEVWSAILPGHGGSAEKPLMDINSLIDLFFAELKSIVKSKYFLFGHSMGGVIAYFLTQRICISTEYLAKPTALILSAADTPHSFRSKNYSSWSDEDILKYLVSIDSITEELLQEKSLLEYFMPVFRADFKILESSSYCTFTPLDLPVFFLWGENDKIISFDSALQWSRYFASPINLIPIENGSHMFIHDQSKLTTKKIEDIIELLQI